MYNIRLVICTIYQKKIFNRSITYNSFYCSRLFKNTLFFSLQKIERDKGEFIDKDKIGRSHFKLDFSPFVTKREIYTNAFSLRANPVQKRIFIPNHLGIAGDAFCFNPDFFLRISALTSALELRQFGFCHMRMMNITTNVLFDYVFLFL